MSEFAIRTQGLCKHYGRKRVLHNLSLDLPRGGIHALVGSNGAGKSTLFRLLLGLTEPSSGSSEILGCESCQLTPALRGRIGFVNEEHTLPEWMRVEAVMEMQRSLYPQWREATYREVLGNFDVQPGQRVSELSRGERAGFNLSLALAQSPELLILDEPTLGLDVVAKRAFLEALMFIGTDSGCTILYCSHQMEEIERVADNLLIMERGELKSVSPPDEFSARVHHWIVEFPERPPANNEIPGLLQLRRIDDSYQLTVLDAGEPLQQFLQDRGARVHCKLQVSLDEAVNSYLAKNHRTAQAAQ
ncbi:ABC transporter ATP-binding protein [Microbulbifer yueqingensis]|uniref:ABC-2 type transport system ATP-binding protein n=1 Tax=Microbulbifer yueqingensis TaxID=658219 RepID=A0A1G8V4B1_9GAMM|nr:ABC transporter ATP-binding protein [Microbulbifer yueqingensis]SDJ60966.1 ABC-2 type transport system ATP-binding protein [Microbulbifer yueqingensis]